MTGVGRTVVSGRQRLERPLSDDRGRKDHSWQVTEWSDGSLASDGGPAEVRLLAAVLRKFGVRWWSGGSPASGGGPVNGLWSDECPTFADGPVEVWRQAVVQRKSGHQSVVWRKSDVSRWSGGSPACVGSPTEVRHQPVVRRKSDVCRWSDESPMLAGGSAEVQAVVKEEIGGKSDLISLSCFLPPLAWVPFMRKGALFIDFLEWHGLRSNRILGASRSNTHQSMNQSVNHGRQVSASFYPGGQHAAGEGTSGPSLEERIQKMEESQKEILQLLREARQPALITQEEVLLPQDPPLPEGVQFEHLHEESPLPLPRRHPQSRQDNKLADTSSSTHPSHTGQQPRIPPDLPEDLAQPHVAELPHNTLRRELRRLCCVVIDSFFNKDQSDSRNTQSLLHLSHWKINPRGIRSDLFHTEMGPGPEQGMPPVQSQGKASTEIEGKRKAKVV
ncbi:hypothetical protein M5K25_023698 [Dendrobium thyrsiflorum]|uniref:Uncharacterized protein n=1 Tax=Dendrobium thyrsiflorum TaxID=117978 RepID=A0ABD0U0A8_DENTH